MRGMMPKNTLELIGAQYLRSGVGLDAGLENMT